MMHFNETSSEEDCKYSNKKQQIMHIIIMHSDIPILILTSGKDSNDEVCIVY